MTLDEDECWRRLAAADHGMLGTVHPERGVDAVPVVFAVSCRRIVIPIDTVKAKRGPRLQRLANLEADARCVLLVDHYTDDWDELWWVRVHGRGAETEVPEADLAMLADRYPAYEAPDTVVGLIVLTADAVTGWAA